MKLQITRGVDIQMIKEW